VWQYFFLLGFVLFLDGGGEGAAGVLAHVELLEGRVGFGVEGEGKLEKSFWLRL
jgi:hypothetical protein